MSGNASTKKTTTSAAADDDIHQPKRVVMKPEELEKTAERLYGHSAKKIQERRQKFEEDVEFQATHNAKLKAKSSEPTAEEAKALERLYSQPMEKKKRNLEASEKKLAAEVPVSKKVSPEEADQICDRLFTQSVKRKQQSLEAAERKVYQPAEEKKLDKEQLKTRVDSLFTAAVEKKKTATEKLSEKYLWKVEKKKISKAQIDDLAARLSTKSGN